MLARELKYTLKDLLDSLGDGELDLWFEIHKEHPFGDPWWQTGMLCSTIANFNPWGTKRFVRPEEFMPLHREPLTPQQLFDKTMAALAAIGVPVIDNRSCSTSTAPSTTAN